MLPLGDSPNPRGTPIVTYLLIAANVALYVFVTVPLSSAPVNPRDPLLQTYIDAITPALPQGVSLRDALGQISQYDLYVFIHGFRPAAPSPFDLLYALFLHANFLHLFGNMLFLWIYGDNVEYRLGRLPYLAAYLGTGAIATLFHTMFALGSPLPLIGASGAISGVLGFYFVWFPRNQVRILLFFPFFSIIAVPARLVLGMYLILDNVVPFLVNGAGGGGVAHGAHIGGFIAGLLAAWVVDRREVSETPRDYRGAAAIDGDSPGAIRAAIRAGDMREAAQLYFALPPATTRRALAPEDAIALGDWLRASGHAEAALTTYRRLLRDYPSGPMRAEAHLGAGLLQLDPFGQVAPAYQHFLEALDSDPSPDVARQAREALAQIERLQKFQIGRARG